MMEKEIRVGTGYDIHRLEPSGELFLGGVFIEKGRSLVGHSDGDVVLHAVCDALLGAAAMGDIGECFPDTDPKYKNAASSKFLRGVWDRLSEGNWHLGNLDITLIIQSPRMSVFREKMISCISGIIGTSQSRVNIKFKTAEGVGEAGRGQIATCHAVCCIERKEKGNKCIS